MSTPISTTLKTAAAGLVAAALLAGSTIPSSAWSMHAIGHTTHTLGYTAAPGHAWSLNAASGEDRMVDDATAYCLDRFKSYDPEFGTYRGYDGVEHPCP